jgi:formylglycine-generating enzyme required for sulfatase activity
MSHRRATPAKGAHALALLLTLAACGGNVQRSPSQLSVGVSTTTAPTAAAATAPAEMVLIKGGTLRMGADDEMPDESPAHEVTLESFWIDRNEVTVGEFARFVEATGYTTEAERFGWAGVFDISSGALPTQSFSDLLSKIDEETFVSGILLAAARIRRRRHDLRATQGRNAQAAFAERQSRNQLRTRPGGRSRLLGQL